MITTMHVNVKKLNENAVLPTYGSANAAGADIYACLDAPLTIAPHETVMVHTGLAMEIPEGYAGLIYARSGLACKRNLAPANKVGVVDSDYRGEFMIALHNHGTTSQTIEPKERIAQLVITPYIVGQFEIVDELDTTERGAGGFGSTGTNLNLYNGKI